MGFLGAGLSGAWAARVSAALTGTRTIVTLPAMNGCFVPFLLRQALRISGPALL